jgi:uncharacterized protein (TIGR00375 family)
MKSFDCDLQLHGKYASGVSKNISIPLLARQARKKGLEVLVTGDIQHREWFAHVKEELEETENGSFTDHEHLVNFIIGTEVEDQNRLHHLIYLPDLARAQEFREAVKPFGTLDCSMCGRAKLRLSPARIAEIVTELGGLCGPAHSFTPYTGLFSKYDSVQEAYGEMSDRIPFLELGLSADTDLADTISKNHSFAFLSSSDAHSAWPHRLGREWNRIKLKRPDFKSLSDALWQRGEPAIEFNAGLDPREGKYHKTACNACYAQYSLEQAEGVFKWKCPACGGEIKRGVRDRIAMLADLPTGKHPAFRPPYRHMLPLAEIIQLSLGQQNVLSKKVQSRWADFVERFGNEIAVLIDAPENDLVEFDPVIGKKIVAFREGMVWYEAGGGGKYGTPHLFDSAAERDAFAQAQKKKEKEKNKYDGQQTLFRH